MAEESSLPAELLAASKEVGPAVGSPLAALKASGGGPALLRGGGGKAALVATGASLAVDWAIENAPIVWEKVKDYFSVSGMSEADVRAMPRGNILERLAFFGVTADQLAGIGLTADEMNIFVQLVAKYRAAQSASQDAAQAARPSTGDLAVDRDLSNLAIARACQLLGLVGAKRASRLYDLALTLNSITERDVEAFERHERMFGTIRAVR